MSTRAHVIVTDSKQTCYVYHHSDGYPAGVGQGLIDFVNEHKDIDIWSADKFCMELEVFDSEFEFENHGIHGDEDYLYNVRIYNDNITIQCEAVGFEDEDIDDMFPFVLNKYDIEEQDNTVEESCPTRYEQMKIINDMLINLSKTVYDCEEIFEIINPKLKDVLSNVKEATESAYKNSEKLKQAVFNTK